MPNENQIAGRNNKAETWPHGFKLRQTLRGHLATVNNVSWSPDGLLLASASADHDAWLWDVASGQRLLILKGHSSFVNDIEWSPDGRTLASASGDGTARLWDAASGQTLWILKGHSNFVNDVEWSPDGRMLASASADGTVRLWEVSSGRELRILEGHSDAVNCVSWSPDGRRLASASADGTVRLWEPTGESLSMVLNGHSNFVNAVSWSPDSRTLASASADLTVRLWEPGSGRQLRVLEGQGRPVNGVSWSPFDRRTLASSSQDGATWLWDCGTWEPVAKLSQSFGAYLPLVTVVAFHPHARTIAILDETGYEIRLWDFDFDVLLGDVSTASTVHHVTAKVVLVGDAGVGKSGLWYRLVHGTYKNQTSTHGQQFWVLKELKHRRTDGAECEVILWDLAGQPDYRLVHPLFLGEPDLALVLFNPANRQEPLHGVDFWLKALEYDRQHACRTILVGARIDVGPPTLTSENIDSFCRDRGIEGGYVATSAQRGDGLDELLKRMKGEIQWDAIPAITTTETFKRIKDFVLRLKEDPRQTDLLIEPVSLRRQILEKYPTWEISDEEVMIAVRHLANHGNIRELTTSTGERRVLLVPEILHNLAASFVLEARRNPKGAGSLNEDLLLKGEYLFPELVELEESSRQPLLDATTTLFLGHNICFRETDGRSTYLIFPEVINEKKPRMEEDLRMQDDASYTVSGDIGNVYAAVVVLLGYTNLFTRTDQWQDQAQYVIGKDEVCGFRQLATRSEGVVEFVLYYGNDVGQSTRDLFRGLFERFLTRRRKTSTGSGVRVTRFRAVVCPSPKCTYRLGREEVIRQVQEGLLTMYCIRCGKKIDLKGVAEAVVPGQIKRDPVGREQIAADMRTDFESALVTVKSKSLGQERHPTCFISYAWGHRQHEQWVEKLARDLQYAGIEVILDRWQNAAIGSSIARFVALLEDPKTFVVAVGTPLYREKYKNQRSVSAGEVDLIDIRALGTQEEKATVLPVLLDGDAQKSLPPLMRGKVYADFRREDAYFLSLFDLVLTMYRIPFENAAVAHFREELLRKLSFLNRSTSGSLA